ncbi:MAG TPA: helix-turn-helix transcriptional regulator [Opitutus sp.]|nr:helix-turn-helix transcriptional regulator [Opitutus sp.]
MHASIQHFAITRSAPEPLARLANQRGGFTSQCTPAVRPLERDVQRALELARADISLDRVKQMRTALLAMILAEGGFFASNAGAITTDPRIDLGALDKWLGSLDKKVPTIAEIAAHFQLSPSRFRTVFRVEHGIAVGEFLLARREAEARRLLAETREPLKAIAAALGYADPVGFHRAFKSRVGQTPAAFRRQHIITG